MYCFPETTGLILIPVSAEMTKNHPLRTMSSSSTNIMSTSSGPIMSNISKIDAMLKYLRNMITANLVFDCLTTSNVFCTNKKVVYRCFIK